MAATTRNSLTHEILIIDATLKKNLSNHYDDIIQKLVMDLLTQLKMDKLGELKIYGAKDLTAPGWSFIQPITTSHISGHYFESSKPSIHIDVYSCKSIDYIKVLNIVHKHLNLAAWTGNFIVRKQNLSTRLIATLKGVGKKIIIKKLLVLSA